MRKSWKMRLDLMGLSLDLNCGFVPKSIQDLLTEISMIDEISKKLSKLNDFVYVLEQELEKIDAFKRELPLCMLLLNDAIAQLKEEVVQCKRREVEAEVMEEFMPLKGNSVAEGRAKKSADWTDKKNWMSSAQLWSPPIQYENNFDTVKIQDSIFLQQSRNQERDDGMARRNPNESWNFDNKGEAFVTFKKPYSGAVKAEEDDLAVDGLCLSMAVADQMASVDKTLTGKNVANDYGVSEGSSSQPQGKKQRRCWSQELHQSFVNALLELGGAQAATPKQIREIMQVDSLTNDEVKSHLQKYRLHIRQMLSNSSNASPNYDWLRREEYSHLPTSSAAQFGSPEGPLHLGGSAKGVSVTGAESIEEDEDLKSESHSWKAHVQKLRK